MILEKSRQAKLLKLVHDNIYNHKKNNFEWKQFELQYYNADLNEYFKIHRSATVSVIQKKFVANPLRSISVNTISWNITNCIMRLKWLELKLPMQNFRIHNTLIILEHTVLFTWMSLKMTIFYYTINVKNIR